MCTDPSYCQAIYGTLSWSRGNCCISQSQIAFAWLSYASNTRILNEISYHSCCMGFCLFPNGIAAYFFCYLICPNYFFTCIFYYLSTLNMLLAFHLLLSCCYSYWFTFNIVLLFSQVFSSLTQPQKWMSTRSEELGLFKPTSGKAVDYV